MEPLKTTPMIKQYLSIKQQYDDAVLFFRMGDFYEMFFEDAEVASRVLDIALTSRNKNDKTPIPMCGVPHRAAKGYIARLIDKGYKVAICDQIEDPSQAKGLVKRDVVRVVTRGMVIEDELLEEKSNNYILALAGDHHQIGLSYLDISTGTFKVAESGNPALIGDEVLRIGPSEVLLPASSRDHPDFAGIVRVISDESVSYLDHGAFDYEKGRERLLDQFKTLSLEGFGCDHFNAGIRAAGALLYYIGETQKQKITHLSAISTYHPDQYLWLDDDGCRNLEVLENIRNRSTQGTLISILDKTVTAMGGRRFKHWIRYPLINRDDIVSRLDAVEEALERMETTGRIRDRLKSVADLERLNGKISMGHANARDLLALKRSLSQLPRIWSYLQSYRSPLYQFDGDLEPLSFLSDLIEKGIDEDAPPVIHEGHIIKPGYHPELDELIALTRDGKDWLAKLETTEREATGIQSLKVKYNKVFGYYIEIPKAKAGQAPLHYIRKQTLVNAERFITDELKSFETKVLNAQEKRALLEHQLFQEIRQEVIKRSAYIASAADFIARSDCLFALAEAADQNDYHRPFIQNDGSIKIIEGRHPVVEKMIAGERFVPNTIHLDNRDNQVLIITGPNMAGKSTVLRQVALIVIMAQMGSFVPAKKASISLTDQIFTRIGALDNLSSGLSTFMVEMQETADILNNATAQSLIIMDEIGRGTSTFDGLSIAWAVAEYLHDFKTVGVKTLFATHYHELTALEKIRHRVKNFNIAVRESKGDIIFLRTLVPGSTNRSYGIHVAGLAGIPLDVVRRAKGILSDIEQHDRTLKGDLFSPDMPAKTETDDSGPCEPAEPAENPVIKKLKKLDITRMTPLEALTFLNELQTDAGQSD